MIVTIDGPAGSGKSTAARGLARRLGFDYVDTGAMYRAVALACLEEQIDCNDADAVAVRTRQLAIVFRGETVFDHSRDVTRAIREPAVSEAASRVAQHPDVRSELVRQQRAIVQDRDVVTEGRDQGTVVFPDADCKFFIAADADERARRRQQELQLGGREVSLEPADDAINVDTTNLDQDAVGDLLEQHVRARMS